MIHQKDAGVSVAWNIALRMAKGLYVYFVDADDVITREWLQFFHKVIEDEGCDVVRGRFKYWHGDRSLEELINPNWQILTRYQTPQEVHICSMSEALENGYSFQNCIKRDKILDLKFPIGVRIVEDSIFNAYVMSHVESVIVSDYVGYLYRINETSATHSSSIGHSRVLDYCFLYIALNDFWGDVNSRK